MNPSNVTRYYPTTLAGEKASRTRMESAASQEGLTLEQFARLNDGEILRKANLGRTSLAWLRSTYPDAGAAAQVDVVTVRERYQTIVRELIAEKAVLEALLAKIDAALGGGAA